MRFSKFLSSCCTSFLVLLAATPDADADENVTVTPADCMMGITALRLDLTQTHYYDQWFREESVLILPNAGAYYGPLDIREYFQFATPESPFVDEREDLFKAPPRLKHVEDGICTFTSHGTFRFKLNPEKANDATALVNSMYKFKFDYKENYIPEVYIHFQQEFYEAIFGVLLDTDNARRTICDISDNRCPNTNVGMSTEECMQKLKDIPTMTDGTQFDAYDFGCRVLHSVLAEFNVKHCPHISFEPQLDQDGKYKCQETAGLHPKDYFDEDDFTTFYEYLDSEASFTETRAGFKILRYPSKYSTRHYILVGLVAPLIIFSTVFFMVWKSQTDESENKEGTNALFADNLRKFRIIVGSLIGTLFLVNGVAAAIIWALAGSHPEWIHEEYENKMEDKYRGAGDGIVLESVPHALLTDLQFRVYAGYVVWVGVLIAGLGLEVFVWYHFLQFWSKAREGLWRFSQFVFPLLLVTSLGLALHRNFLSLPILVVGLWKFGFPETLMYFYLGIFSSSKSRLRRASDFLNGVGTVTHHGAASFVISMLCIGVAPPSRYVLNCCLILVMQHWVAIMAYAYLPLYSAIELTLEFWFQWIVLSDFSQIFYLHWTMGLGAGVMLFAHWVYLAAAVLDMFADEATTHEENVHMRGNKMMGEENKKMVPSKPSDSLGRAPMRRGSSVIGLTLHQGSSRRSSTMMNKRESIALLNSLSSKKEKSRMPMSMKLADSFLQLQVESHLEGIEDDEEMIEFDSIAEE